MSRVRHGLAPVVLCAALWIGPAAAHAVLPNGLLDQLPDTAGCFTFNGASEDGASTCNVARAAAEVESAIPSPDGRNVYVGSYPNSPTLPPSLLVYTRNPTTSALTQLAGIAGCFTPDGSSSDGAGTCTKARGLRSEAGDGRDIVFTGDGLWVYFVAQNDTNAAVSGAVLIFRRDPSTGALTQLPGTAGCISSDGSSQDGAMTCQTDATLSQPMGVTMSADERFLYVTDYGATNRLHVYSRDKSTGALTPIQCLAEKVAPLGCTEGRVVGNSQSVVITPDGQHLYAGSYDFGMSIFNRDPATGLLTQESGTAGCVTDNGNDDTATNTCASGRQLRGSYALTLSKDGRTLYDPAGEDGGIGVWRVNPDGTLSQLPGADGCVTIDGIDSNSVATCAVGRAIVQPYGSAISPDGSTLYVSDIVDRGGIAIFSLDPASGRATQVPGIGGCWTTDGNSGTATGVCSNGRALATGWAIAVTADGRSVYEATDDDANAGITVFSRGIAPTCSGASVSVPHGTPVRIALTCSDGNGDAVTRLIATAPSHGFLGPIDNSAGAVTYTPAAGFGGSDSFQFVASDGVNTTPATTVSLSVAGFKVAKLRARVLVLDAKGRFKLKVSCPANAPTGACSDVASLYTPDGALPKSAAAKKKKRRKALLLARARFSVKAGKSVTKTVRLNRAGRKFAKTRARFRARLRLTTTSSATASTRQTVKVTVKHAKKKRKHRR